MSISTLRKSIIPLFSCVSRCYNDHTSRVEAASSPCKLINAIFQIWVANILKRRYFAMNAIKRYFVSMMQEYGRILAMGGTIVNIWYTNTAALPSYHFSFYRRYAIWSLLRSTLSPLPWSTASFWICTTGQAGSKQHRTVQRNSSAPFFSVRVNRFCSLHDGYLSR